jgi:hypothetical protein
VITGAVPRLFQLGCDGGEPGLIADVDHDLATGLSERFGASKAEAAARRANDCLAASDPKVHA